MVSVPGSIYTPLPFGVADDEPLADIGSLGASLGIRQAVYLGMLTLEQGKEFYPAGDWSVIDD